MQARREESNRKSEMMRRLRLQEAKVADAQARLEEMRDEAANAGVLDESDALKIALERNEQFEVEAGLNADNVTANRVKEFLTANPGVQSVLAMWAFNRGYTSFDVDAMWAKLQGNPRPIVIEPERPVSMLDWLEEEDEVEDEAA